MACAGVKKLTSLFLIVMILSASLFGMCQDTHASEQSRETHVHGACDAFLEAAADHCPSCPSSDQTEKDHCASSCYCSCHLPVTVLPVHIRFSPIVTDLIVSEPFKALPEVHLSKFIPPHILV